MGKYSKRRLSRQIRTKTGLPTPICAELAKGIENVSPAALRSHLMIRKSQTASQAALTIIHKDKGCRCCYGYGYIHGPKGEFELYNY